MNIKMIKVSKNGVTKEIEARLEKDYIKNGWIVVENLENNNPFIPPYNFKK